MAEIWIRPNRRVLGLGFLVPSLLLICGGLAIAWGQGREGMFWMQIVGGVLVAVSVIIFATLAKMMREPRVAYEGDEVLLYLGLSQPIRIPVGVVECFFLGQAGGMIPDSKGSEAEVRTVILRLAEAAKEWHHRDVKAALGHWCEGYITIRGTWCEPVTPDLMKKLNQRLVQVQRELKERRQEATP